MAEDNDELAEFEAYGSAGDGGDDLAEFEAYGGGVAEPAGGAQPVASAPAPEPTGLERLSQIAEGGVGQFLMGLGDGASLGHGRWLSNVGSRIGSGVYGLTHPEAINRSAGADEGGELMDKAGSSLAGQAGKGLGTVAASIGAAGLAPMTMPAQAAVGAGLGAGSAHGRGESALGGALVGGGLGALGGLAAARTAASMGGPAMRMGVPTTGTRAGQIAETIASKLPGGTSTAAVGAGLGAANEAARGNLSPLDLLKGAGKGAAMGYAAPKLLSEGALMSAAPVMRGLGGLAASGLGGMLGDEASPISKAKAQDAPWNVETGDAELYQDGVRANIGEPQFRPVRDEQVTSEFGEAIEQPYGGWTVETGEAQVRDTSPAATQSWAVESVLYQGNTGLPREAEQQLTEAALSGDPERLATATFLLSGKYPQFSDALQKQRASLVREEE